MSYFGNALGDILEKKKISQTELSRLTELSQAHLSKLINGVQIWLSPEDLDAICTSVTNEKLEQAELIRAHLMDECNGPGSDLIDIQIKRRSGTIYEEAFPQRSAIPSKFAKHLEILSRHAEDKDLRTIIEGLASVFHKEKHQINIDELASNINPDLKADTVRKVVDTLTKKKGSRLSGASGQKNPS